MIMKNKKEILLERFVDNISKSKIDKFCTLLENSEIKLSDDVFTIKKKIGINSNEEKYFLNIISNFSNKEDIILLIKLITEIKNTKSKINENTSLAWSSPIKYHKKIDQTYSTFLKLINNSEESIIFVGYAMTDDENQDIFDALKNAAKERHVKIKIIFYSNLICHVQQ